MNDIVFIDSSDSFVVKSITQNIGAAGYSCMIAEWTTDSLSKIIDDISDIIVGYIDDIDDIEDDCVNLIKELVSGGKRLCLMGRSDDISEFKSTYSIENVTEEFYRPINADDVSDRIVMLTDTGVVSLKKHILVVDDSGIMLTTMQDLLGAKYKISVANSAMNAVRFLSKAKNKPDLILLDYEMPVCSGPQLFEMLRDEKETSDIPIIFLTGKDDPESVQSVIALKPAGYLLKNMPKKFIVQRVDEFFEEQN